MHYCDLWILIDTIKCCISCQITKYNKFQGKTRKSKRQSKRYGRGSNEECILHLPQCSGKYPDINFLNISWAYHLNCRTLCGSEDWDTELQRRRSDERLCSQSSSRHWLPDKGVLDSYSVKVFLNNFLARTGAPGVLISDLCLSVCLCVCLCVYFMHSRFIKAFK